MNLEASLKHFSPQGMHLNEDVEGLIDICIREETLANREFTRVTGFDEDGCKV